MIILQTSNGRAAFVCIRYLTKCMYESQGKTFIPV